MSERDRSTYAATLSPSEAKVFEEVVTRGGGRVSLLPKADRTVVVWFSADQ